MSAVVLLHVVRVRRYEGFVDRKLYCCATETDAARCSPDHPRRRWAEVDMFIGRADTGMGLRLRTGGLA